MFLQVDSEDSDQTGRMRRLIIFSVIEKGSCQMFNLSAQE